MESDEYPLRAFISYKWEDESHNEWVKKFATDLKNAGIEAILDRWEVGFGDSFTDYMTSKISAADVILFIITTASVAAVEAPKGQGGAVKFEMQMATNRRIDGEEIRLIGIYREGNKTPAHLRDHRYADFRDDSMYEQNLESLIEDLMNRAAVPPLHSRPDEAPSQTAERQLRKRDVDTTSEKVEELLGEQLIAPKLFSQLLHDTDFIIFGSHFPIDIGIGLLNRDGPPIEIVDLLQTAPWMKLVNMHEVLGSVLDSSDEINLRVQIIPDNITEQTLGCSSSIDRLLYLLKNEGIELTYRDCITNKVGKYLIPIEIAVRRLEPLRYPLTIDFGISHTRAAFIPNHSTSVNLAALDEEGFEPPSSGIPSCMRFFDHDKDPIDVGIGYAVLQTRFRNKSMFKATAYGWKQDLIDNKPKVFWDFQNRGRLYTPVELTSIYIDIIIKKFESRYRFEVKKVSLTYPNTNVKARLIESMERAGYTKDNIIVNISEPEALMLAYIYNHPEEFYNMKEGSEQIIAIFGVGDSGIDISIARLCMGQDVKRITVMLSERVKGYGDDYITYLLARKLYKEALNEVADTGKEGKVLEAEYPFPLEYHESVAPVFLFAMGDAERENYRVFMDAANNMKLDYGRLANSPEHPILFSVTMRSVDEMLEARQVSITKNDFDWAVTDAIMESIHKLNSKIEELFYSDDKMDKPRLDLLVLGGNGARLQLIETLVREHALVVEGPGGGNVRIDYDITETGVVQGGAIYNILQTGAIKSIIFERAERLTFSIGYDRGGGIFKEAFSRWTIISSTESESITHLTPKFHTGHLDWFSIYINKSLEKEPNILNNPEIVPIAHIPLPMQNSELGEYGIAIELEILKNNPLKLDYRIFQVTGHEQDVFEIVDQGSAEIGSIGE